ncbi:CAP domain-containing protein [Myxococcota bacterium]|nr:CAP domain-containing protein [Myxococcota bacterium]
MKISGKVDNDVTKLELLMTLPGGKVKRRKVSLLGAGVFAHAEYFCTKEKKGHYSVELMGEDGHGPVVLALFPVACGSADHLRKVRVTMKKPTVDMAASKAAREAFDLVNAYRKKNKMKAYKWSVKLAAVATAHSDEMCKFKSIYHLSPITGAPDKRVKRAGIKTDLVAENVAVASSPESIVSSWIMSEGHRLNMVLKDGVYGAVGVCKASINKSIHYYATLVVTGKIR